jgi:hypothetical protein
MLEAAHEDLLDLAKDAVAYHLGNISQHNAVIACSPIGKMRNNN